MKPPTPVPLVAERTVSVREILDVMQRCGHAHVAGWADVEKCVQTPGVLFYAIRDNPKGKTLGFFLFWIRQPDQAELHTEMAPGARGKVAILGFRAALAAFRQDNPGVTRVTTEVNPDEVHLRSIARAFGFGDSVPTLGKTTLTYTLSLQ